MLLLDSRRSVVAVLLYMSAVTLVRPLLLRSKMVAFGVVVSELVEDATGVFELFRLVPTRYPK